MNTLVITGIYKARNILVSLMLLTGASLQPIHLDHFNIVKIQNPLVIQISKDHPPRIALEEVLRSAAVSKEKIFKTEDLNSQARMISLTEKSNKRILPMLTITHEEVKAYENEQVAQNEWVNQLPPQQRNRIIAAQEKHKTLDQDWRPPELKVLLNEKLKEITSEEKESSRGQVVVAAQGSDGRWRTPEDRSRPSVSERKEDPNPQQPREGHLLAGRFKVNGLINPLVPGTHFMFWREEGYTPQEQGQVDDNGNYKIQVSKMTGSLVLQLVNEKLGGVIGEGRLRLNSVAQFSAHNEIVVEKKATTVASQYIPFDKINDRYRAQNQAGVQGKVMMTGLDDLEIETEKNGYVEQESIQYGSWMIMRNQSKGFYPSLQIIKSGSEKRLPLFRKEMIAALQNIIRDQKTFSDFRENGSVVWGRVLVDGKPASGVKIEVEGYPDLKANYLNNLLIPDSRLKSTASEGYFVILNLPPGMHSLKAVGGNDYLAHVNVVTDEDTISPIEMITTNESLVAAVSVFDAFSGRAEMADVEVQSLPQKISVQGYTEIYLPKVERLGFVSIQPNNERYAKTNQVYDDLDDSIYIPLVEQTWLKNIREMRRINLFPDSATIVGFVQNETFDVYLPHVKDYSKENLIFFDVQGNLSEVPVAGGGFILFNVPQGVQSVSVMGQQTQLVHTQVVPADTDSISILQFRN